MSKSKELAKTTFILLIGNLCTKAAQFLLLPLYTGILSTEEYGSAELANTIIELLLPFVGFQIDQGIFRFLISTRNNHNDTKKLLSTSLFFLTLSNLICVAIFLVASPFITYNFKWLILINLITNSFYSFAMQASRGFGKPTTYTISGFSSAIITIIFNIFFLVSLHFKAEGLLYSGAIAHAIMCVVLFYKLRMNTYISIKSFDKSTLKELLKYSIPVVFNSISWWIFSSSDRIITSSILGLSATGVLSVAYKLSSIVIVLYNVFYMSLAESVALHIDDDDFEDFYNKIFVSISELFLAMGSILIAAMPIIFMILVNNSYSSAYGLIPIAILATIVQVFTGLYSTLYTAKKKTKSIALTSLLAAIINIVVNLGTIHYIGIYAAVVSTLISYIALFIYRHIDINKNFIKLGVNKKLLVNTLISGVLVSILYYCDNIIIRIINILIAVIFAIYFNKENLRFIYNIVREKGKRGIKG